MKRTIVSAFVALLLVLSIGEAEGARNWRFGGSFGMSFTDSYSNIKVAPQLSYRLTNFLSLGVGVSYSHYKDKVYDQSVNYVGANINGRIYPFRFVTAFVQPEIQHRWGRTGGRDHHNQATFTTCLVGGGLVIPVGFRTSLVAEVYYDVIQNSHTPYGKNLGYSVGFHYSF